MNEETFSIWTPHQAFYIQSMLFNTTSALQSCNIAGKIIKMISDGEIDPQERRTYAGLLAEHRQPVWIYIAIFFSVASWCEGSGQKTIHSDRGHYLSKIFCVKDGSPLMNRGLRISIEHFDERLDLYLQGGIVGYIFPSLILPEPEDSDVPHHIFRAYYLKEGIFQVLGERYEIQPIVDEGSQYS